MSSQILKAIDKAGDWLTYDGVEGVGQGEKDGKACIIVFVSCRPSDLARKIPSTFMGFPVIYQESGILSAR
jgi:hypothetical protein